ncbi:hypothetical protein NEOLI_001806 [Neolecta irregularis DAH-3]|uniref:F-box domain-containing protein n=1 Tax=Neolecta irregularis (strain DAH-3) TaxID=1198029 RepID=A0A1U7LPM8_NEOID|nr:hypothetical protein NEOLI_001806 [Neolecta irregularis DAH-3]|eukprot:OLL24543.1 hypothetical protein NEOLI_001806 [Neolecta irregularis DAH-3]
MHFNESEVSNLPVENENIGFISHVSDECKKNTGFNKLPVEMVSLILGNLEQADLVRLLSVNKSISQASLYTLWQEIECSFGTRFQSILKADRRNRGYIRKLIVSVPPRHLDLDSNGMLMDGNFVVECLDLWMKEILDFVDGSRNAQIELYIRLPLRLHRGYVGKIHLFLRNLASRTLGSWTIDSISYSPDLSVLAWSDDLLETAKILGDRLQKITVREDGKNIAQGLEIWLRYCKSISTITVFDLGGASSVRIPLITTWALPPCVSYIRTNAVFFCPSNFLRTYKFSGAVDDKIWRYLTSCSSLRQIELRIMSFSGSRPKTRGLLPQLEELNFYTSHIRGDDSKTIEVIWDLFRLLIRMAGALKRIAFWGEIPASSFQVMAENLRQLDTFTCYCFHERELKFTEMKHVICRLENLRIIRIELRKDTFRIENSQLAIFSQLGELAEISCCVEEFRLKIVLFFQQDTWVELVGRKMRPKNMWSGEFYSRAGWEKVNVNTLDIIVSQLVLRAENIQM